MKTNRRKRRLQKGQTITEYVLIIAVVVVAAVGILSLFSDTVRSKIGGIIQVFDPQAQPEVQNGETVLQDLGSDLNDN